MKKQLIIISSLLGLLGILGVINYTPVFSGIGGSIILLEPKVSDTDISGFEITQQINKISKGKYKHVPMFTTSDSTYQIDEYEMPDGQVGYTITIWQERKGETYMRVKNYGPLTNREQAWISLTENDA